MTVILPGDLGCDYAYPKPHTIQDLKAQHVTFVFRYITRGQNPKALTPQERDALLAAGVTILLCWETSTSAIDGGAAGGARDGRDAAKAATLLGYPVDCAIFAAVDTDVYAKNLDNAKAYLLAFFANSGPYRPGIYADEDAYHAVATSGPVWCIPNASGWSPWDRKRPDPAVHVRQGHQNNQLAWDYPNVCMRPLLGWGLVKPTPTSKGTFAMLAHNSEAITLDRVYQPGEVKWVIHHDPAKALGTEFTKAHLELSDYAHVVGLPEGGLSNSQLAGIPDVA